MNVIENMLDNKNDFVKTWKKKSLGNKRKNLALSMYYKTSSVYIFFSLKNQIWTACNSNDTDEVENIVVVNSL